MTHEPEAALPRSGLVFAAYNAHCAECGEPPATVSKPEGENFYCGFYQTDLGEQLVLVVDRKKKTGELRGGDWGWEELIAIRDNAIDGDVIISGEVFAWLEICWKAATGETLDEPSYFGLLRGLTQSDPNGSNGSG